MEQVTQESKVVPVWLCDSCGAGDDRTKFRNKWCVTLQGEHAVLGESFGEESDVVYEFEVCDACSRSKLAALTVLQLAANTELLNLRQGAGL